MLSFMKRLLLFAALFFPWFSLGVEQELLITAEQWARPRQGDALSTLEPLVAAVQRLKQLPRGHLVIRHPAGEEGILWAQELRAWLVALGVSSEDIGIAADSPREDAVYLEVRGGVSSS